MAKTRPEALVAAAMQPVTVLEIPQVLQASIERQSRALMGLATSLLHAGMDDQQVRVVIDQAYTSYRDELTAAILALREHHET